MESWDRGEGPKILEGKFIYLEKGTKISKIPHIGFDRLEKLLQFEIGVGCYACVNLVTPTVIIYYLIKICSSKLYRREI